jgi:Fe-S-cluster containining protein
MVRALPMLNFLDDLPACAGCGICCHLVVELMPGIDRVPEGLVVEHDGVRCMEQRGDGACVALDPVTRLCTIYERRPKACRDFQRAEALCRKAVARAAAAPVNRRGSAS